MVNYRFSAKTILSATALIAVTAFMFLSCNTINRQFYEEKLPDEEISIIYNYPIIDGEASKDNAFVIITHVDGKEFKIPKGGSLKIKPGKHDLKMILDKIPCKPLKLNFTVEKGKAYFIGVLSIEKKPYYDTKVSVKTKSSGRVDWNSSGPTTGKYYRWKVGIANAETNRIIASVEDKSKSMTDIANELRNKKKKRW